MSIQRWHAAHCYSPYNATWSHPGCTAATDNPAVYTNMIAVCRLCSQIPVQPVYLSCKDIFCSLCLQSYMHHGRYMDSLDFPCPFCKKLSAPPWGIWHLSHKVLDRSHDELYQTWKYEAMCDNCASQALYATAGRQCTLCNICMCDTCAYAHSVGLDTQSHPIVMLNTKDGTTNMKSQSGMTRNGHSNMWMSDSSGYSLSNQ